MRGRSPRRLVWPAKPPLSSGRRWPFAGQPTIRVSGAGNGMDGSKDWLGYDDYAESLWVRIQREFAAQPIATDKRLPSGDPLVIGV